MSQLSVHLFFKDCKSGRQLTVMTQKAVYIGDVVLVVELVSVYVEYELEELHLIVQVGVCVLELRAIAFTLDTHRLAVSELARDALATERAHRILAH